MAAVYYSMVRQTQLFRVGVSTTENWPRCTPVKIARTIKIESAAITPTGRVYRDYYC